MPSQYKAVIFDLGGVLLNWDPSSITALSPGQLRSIMHSKVWHELDRGNILLHEACEQFSGLIDAEASVIKQSLDQAQKSLAVNMQMARMIEELHEVSPDLRFYIMSNISREHFEIVQNLALPWSLFSETFASGHIGMRKPDLCFFEHVIHRTGCHPNELIMVDDQAENICAARSLGIHGLLMLNEGSINIVCQEVGNLVQSAIPRAEAYLKANARNHHCVVDGHDVVLKDNFAQLLIWEITHDEDIIYLKWPSGRHHPTQTLANGHKNNAKASLHTNFKNGLWNYFYEDPILTTKSFPADADTTSTAYLALPERYLSEVADVHLVLDKMASNRNSEGIMQTYFCDDRPRTAPEVCVNILRAFYRFGRGGDPRIRKTEDWVVQCLENRAYLYGNRVYSTPETFLYFTARLYTECGNGPLNDRLRGIREALVEQINTPTNPLSLALRLSACQVIGVDPVIYRQDLRRFLLLQEQDGGFPAGHFCCIGRTGARIGNRGLTTALATNILRHDALSTP